MAMKAALRKFASVTSSACSRRLLPALLRHSSVPVRGLSTDLTSPYTHLQLTQDGGTGVSTLHMNKKPVNSLSLESLTELNIALQKLENDTSCRGVILTSAVPKIFCAGLDIMEMYQPTPDRLAEFWKSLQDFWIRLYGSRLVTIAGINGHSPAGGALIAMSCDHRVMAEGKYTIGLNEVHLGIVAPLWFQDVMKTTVGLRETERALQLGSLYSPERALAVGLVDEVVAEDKVLQTCRQQMETWLKVPDYARQLTKSQLRRESIARLQARKQQDVDDFVNLVTKDSIQRALGMYLESLKKK